jgi:hypothetical protein
VAACQRWQVAFLTLRSVDFAIRQKITNFATFKKITKENISTKTT